MADPWQQWRWNRPMLPKQKNFSDWCDYCHRKHTVEAESPPFWNLKENITSRNNVKFSSHQQDKRSYHKICGYPHEWVFLISPRSGNGSSDLGNHLTTKPNHETAHFFKFPLWFGRISMRFQWLPFGNLLEHESNKQHVSSSKYTTEN